MNGKSYVMRYIIILPLFDAPKRYIFKKISKRCSIDSTLQVDLG